MIVGNGITPMSTSGGRFLYNVELPPSQFYGNASEWISTSILSATAATAPQIVCNGALWIVTSTAIYCRDLVTKEIIETISISVSGGLLVGNTQWPCSICTDGTTRIWFSTYGPSNAGSLSASAAVPYGYIHEFNVINHDLTVYAAVPATNAYSATVYIGYLVYSSYYNRVYAMCNYDTHATTSTSSAETITAGYPTVRYLDLSTGVVKDTGVRPFSNWDSCGFTYEDPSTGFIYFGYGYGATAKTVYRFNPETNTFTTIVSGIGFGSSPLVSYYNLGDSIVRITSDASNKFDPTTGLVEEDQIPGLIGRTIYSNIRGVHNNTLYYALNASDTTMLECQFFSDPPPDAPVVAKIYKGQGFHALVPFSLPRLGIEVTTQQQIAEEDLTIYMYDYSSTGFKLLYIENME